MGCDAAGGSVGVVAEGGRMRKWVGRRIEDSEAKVREGLILELTCGAGA